MLSSYIVIVNYIHYNYCILITYLTSLKQKP